MDMALGESRSASLTSGGATPRSNSGSPGQYGSLVPSSPASGASQSSGHMATSKISVNRYYSASTNYSCLSHGRSSQWPHASSSVSPIISNRICSPSNPGNNTGNNRCNDEANLASVHVGAYQQEQQAEHSSGNLSVFANDKIYISHRQYQSDAGTSSHNYNPATDDIYFPDFGSVPMPTRSHTLTSLLLLGAQRQASGQPVEATTKYTSSTAKVNGDAAFVESLAEYVGE